MTSKKLKSLLVGMALVVLVVATFWRPIEAQSQSLNARLHGIEVAIWGGAQIGGGPLAPGKGLAVTGKAQYCTIPIGSVAYASVGNDTTLSAATSYTYIAGLTIDRNVVASGINVLAGGTAGTSDTWQAAIYPGIGGNAIASTASTATTASGNVFKTLAFATSQSFNGPSLYFVGFQSSGTTETLRTIAASTFVDVNTSKPASTTYGVFPSLGPPTTQTANVGPVACLVVTN